MVRLGEYDTNTETDGKHIDIAIARHVNHQQYDNLIKVHDVSVVHMAQDVDFTGKLKFIH